MGMECPRQHLSKSVSAGEQKLPELSRAFQNFVQMMFGFSTIQNFSTSEGLGVHCFKPKVVQIFFCLQDVGCCGFSEVMFHLWAL